MPSPSLHLADHLVDAACRSGRGSRPCPAVAAMPRPSSRSRLATTSPAGLSPSASDRNTVPAGRQHGAGGQLGLVERPAERASRCPSPRRSSASPGPSAGSTSGKRLNGSTASFTATCPFATAARSRALGAQLGERRAEHHPRRDLGQRHAGRLGDERHGAAGPRVGLDHVHGGAEHRVLHVDQPAHVEARRRSPRCTPRSPRRPTAAASAAGSRTPSRRECTPASSTCSITPPISTSPVWSRIASTSTSVASLEEAVDQHRPLGRQPALAAERCRSRPARPSPAARWLRSWTICIARPPST